MNEYRDEILGAERGDLFTGWGGTFRFRCGPVSRGLDLGNIEFQHKKRGNNKAWGRHRRPKTFRSLKWAYFHELDGIKVRHRGNKDLINELWWDDYPLAHAEKNWKRFRSTQYKAR